METLLTAVVEQLFDSTSEESSSSSSDEEESDFEFSIIRVLGIYSYCQNIRGQIIPLPRIENYLGVINNYSPSLFKSHFRLVIILPETFHHLVTLLKEELNDNVNSPGRPEYPIDYQVLIALWSVCEKFNVGKATAFRTLRRVITAICCLARKIIKWPEGEEVDAVWNGFRSKGPISRVIGAIDGCHIEIRKPSEDGDSFMNRHHKFSIQLQGICDHRARFTHVYVGNCGSVHDQRVFRLSEVNGYLSNPEKYFPGNSHLLGDSAYTINKHLMVPYRDNGHLSAQQIYYNKNHSAARSTIERTFGFLKNRFQSLLYCCPLTDTQFIPKFIMACCVVHNICQMKGDFMDVGSNNQLIHNADERGNEQSSRQNNMNTSEGINKRAQITRDIWPGEL